MAEYLESLKPKQKNNTKIGFLLQGGFGEASQLRCCESYLETLPSLLGCEYNGTLLKGDMFAVSFIGSKMGKQMVEPFYNMGKYYAQNNYFNKEVVNDFAKPEYFSKKEIFLNNVVSPLNKLFMKVFAKKLGCKGSLNDKSYQNYITR